MPTTERIDEIISQKAIDGFDKLTINVSKALAQVEKLIATGVDLNKALGGANSFKGANDGVAKMTENQKALAKQTAELEAAKKKLAASETALAKQIADVNAQIAENNKNLKTSAQINNAVNGSIEAAIARNKDLNNQKQILNITTVAGQKKLAELNKEIEKNNKFIDDAKPKAQKLIDAYGALENKYKASARETQNLAVQYGITDVRTQASAKSTQELYKQLVEADKAVGKFGRNVGNYPTTFQTLGDVGQKSLAKINHGFMDVIKSIAATALAFVGVRGLFEFGKESIEGFEKFEMQTARLENALKNLGATNKDINVLKQQVIDLSATFPYLSKTDLREVQQKLVQYGKLTSAQMKELTPTIVNFAANARIGVVEATDVIVKSMEGNARALKTYGINIKDAKTETERFNLIQDELGRRVAGAAQVFSESSEGKIEAYKRQLAGLKVSIGEQLMPAYQAFLEGSISVIKVIKQIDFGNVIKGIAALAAIWVTYRAVVLVANIATAFNTAAQIANRAASVGSTVAVAAETLAEETNGKVKNSNIIITYALIAAQRVYNATVAALSGPIGIILAVVGLLAISMSAFSRSTGKSADELAKLKSQSEATKEVMSKANEVFAEQKEVVERLTKTINDHTLSNKERKKALEELIALDPKHLEGLTLANIETEKGTKIIDDYVEALHKQAIAEAAESIDKDNQIKKIKAQVDLAQENLNFQNGILIATKKANEEASKNAGDVQGKAGISTSAVDASNQVLAMKRNHKQMVDELSSTIKDVDDKNEVLQKLITNNKKAAGGVTFNQTSGLGQGLHIDEEAAKKAEERARKLALFLIELDDKLAKAKREHAAESLKEIGDDAKAVADDEKAALDKRLQAYDIYAETQAAIISRNAESEIAQQQKILTRIEQLKKKPKSKRTLEEDETIATQELVNQTIINLEQKREDAIINLARTSTKDRLAITKSFQQKELQQRLELYNSSKEADQAKYFDDLTGLEIAYQKQFLAAGKNVKKLEKATREFNEAKLLLQDKFIIASLKKDIDFAESELAIQQAAGIDVSSQIAKLNELKLKLKEAETKFILDQNNQQVASEKNKYDKIADFLTKAKERADAVFDLIGSGIKASIDSQKNALADQAKAIDENAAKQIEAVNSTVASEQDKAAKIAIINARTQAQKDKIAQRQRQLDIQQARFDKIKGISDIIINTAIAVTKFLAKGDVPEAIAAGVIGAAQLAIAIATPIPHFEHGTKDAPGGLAMVSEKRPELIVYPDGSTEVTPNEPTVMNIPAHSVVFPDARKAMETGLAVNREGQLIDHRTYYREMTQALSKDIKQLTKVVAEKEPVIIKKAKTGWEMIKGKNIHLNG